MTTASWTSSDQENARARRDAGDSAAAAEAAAPAIGERRARRLAEAERKSEKALLPTSRRASFVVPELLVTSDAARTRGRRAATGPVDVVRATGRQAAAPVASAPVASAPVASTPAAPATVVSAPVASAPAAPSASAPVGPAAGRPVPRSSEGRRVARRAASSASVAKPTRASSSAAPVGVARRVGSVAKKCVMIAAAVAFAASGTLPLVGALGQTAQAAPGGSSASVLASGGQDYTAGDVGDGDVSRDAYSATSVVDIQTQLLQNKTAKANSTYDGPSTADYLANPTYTTLDRNQVFAVALQYIGTPYVHGGEDPSAFDCSGLITFVYSQFGISLPHYVPSQDKAGKRISQAEAVPGDLVVFDNGAHDGIYAGNGMILDAPKPGGFVSVRPIWDQAHHFVRIGA